MDHYTLPCIACTALAWAFGIPAMLMAVLVLIVPYLVFAAVALSLFALWGWNECRKTGMGFAARMVL